MMRNKVLMLCLIAAGFTSAAQASPLQSNCMTTLPTAAKLSTRGVTPEVSHTLATQNNHVLCHEVPKALLAKLAEAKPVNLQSESTRQALIVRNGK